MSLADAEIGISVSEQSSARRGGNGQGAMGTDALMHLARTRFGEAAQANVPLAPLTSARIGGPADILITAASSDALAEIVSWLWQRGQDWTMLGGGSNVLIRDKGVRGVTVLNRAKAVRFREGQPPSVWAESGVVFSNLANRCAPKGLSGLEWAATVPGTIGGAVYGNAGAFGGDMAGNLELGGRNHGLQSGTMDG